MIPKNWRKDVLLAEYTTFKIGGPAKYFYIAKTSQQLIKAAAAAQKLKIPCFILGGGSNILISDRGFDGLIIKNQTSKIKTQNDLPDQILSLSKIRETPKIFDNEFYRQNLGGQKLKCKILTESGARLERLVRFSIANNLTGLEWAIGIPGTIGGAIRGNSGAFGHSISEIIKSAAVLNLNTLEIENYSGEQCRFYYRESIFKHNKNIILSAEMLLKKGNPQKIFKTINRYIKTRKQKNPCYPSAGSVFKNLQVKNLDLNVIKKISKLKETIKGGKIPAAYFIEDCGLKGKRIGDAQISEKHANFIVNLGEAKAKEVISLINLIKQKTKNKFGVQLQEEIEYLGFA